MPEDSQQTAPKPSPKGLTKPQLAYGLLAAFAVAIVPSAGWYAWGLVTQCGPGKPGGEACNIARGLGAVAALILACFLLFLGLLTLSIVAFVKRRRS